MAGQIKTLIDKIVAMRSKGDPIIASTTKTKMILKGINIKNYDHQSEDDEAVIQRLHEIAEGFGLRL